MAEVNNKQLNKLIENSSRILITGLANPNVDIVSTAVAWWLFLRQQKKEVDVIFDGQISKFKFFPKELKFASHLENLNKFKIVLDISKTKVKQLSYDVIDNALEINLVPEGGTFSANDVVSEQGDYKYDLVICLGAPNLETVGSIFNEHRHFFHQASIINIDRSVLNENFASLNVIKAGATSLAEISYEFLAKSMDKDIATCLLAAMMSATSSFQSAQVIPDTLELASQLITKGADRDQVVESLYRTKNIDTLKNWGKVLSRLHKQNTIITSFLEHDEMDAMPDDFRDMVRDLILATPAAQVAIIFYQLELHQTEAWLYTIDNIDALNLTKELRGEGHKRFARLVIDKGLDKAKELLVKKISDKLKIINSA